MKKILLIMIIGFFLLASAVIESSPAPKTNIKFSQLTRTVLFFSALETELIEALKNNNQIKLKGLLADDFEMRQASEPSSPIPYANWLANSLAEAPNYTVTLEQMSVHDLNQTAIVNFLWLPNTNNEQLPLAKVFVVDVWRQVGERWQLAIRYINSAQDTNAKIPGFVLMPGNSVIEKRY
jgi:hypothetical protein